jgi:hypothetical protein
MSRNPILALSLSLVVLRIINLYGVFQNYLALWRSFCRFFSTFNVRLSYHGTDVLFSMSRLLFTGLKHAARERFLCGPWPLSWIEKMQISMQQKYIFGLISSFQYQLLFKLRHFWSKLVYYAASLDFGLLNLRPLKSFSL